MLVSHTSPATAGAIDRLQRSSARYLHRPDADYLSYDPLRTSMTGMKVVANLERRNARHWLWQAGVETETPEFETNDLGRLSSGDNIGLDSQIEYRETRPGRWLRNYSVSLSPQGAWNYGGDLQEVEIEPSARLTWRNFWQTNLERRDQAPIAEHAPDPRRPVDGAARGLGGRGGRREQRRVAKRAGKCRSPTAGTRMGA